MRPPASRETPLRRIRVALGTPGHPIPLHVIAAAARCSVDTVKKVEALRVDRMTLGALVRVALAVGASPVDLVPGLDARPRGNAVKRVRDLVTQAVYANVPELQEDQAGS